MGGGYGPTTLGSHNNGNYSQINSSFDINNLAKNIASEMLFTNQTYQSANQPSY